jgi:regulator of ribosome biosynthesis
MEDIEMTDTPLETDEVQVPISPSDQIRKEVDTARNNAKRAEVTVTKPIPYTFDLGNLVVNDANPLPTSSSREELLSASRDCAQAIINQLLTTCEIVSTQDGVQINLPSPSTLLPREKAIPKEKEPTKWERFAAKKGIKTKKREGKLVYDEASGEWVPKYGYKGANKAGENDWLVEVDAVKEKSTGEAGDARREKRAERMERMKRQDRKMRANQKRAGKGTIG